MISKDHIMNWQVLVVDDHPDSLEIASLTLELNGAQVKQAENGEAGLALLESFHPNLILLDISMPVMDGWTMLHNIRSNPTLAEIPVVALTAHAMDGDKEMVLEAGFDHYITKPFSPITFIDELLDVINKNPVLAERVKAH